MAGKIKAALLVDADNLPTSQAEEALEKLAEICNPVIKKAFGDFTKSAKNWSPEFMRKHGFTPEMHFAVSNFKNGADIAMCIAAMDIVHAKSVEAIVLFTSDSDFASLAARIREAGLEVVGVGDAKASEVLRSAFSTFIIVDPPKKVTKEPVKVASKPAKPKEPTNISSPKAVASKPQKKVSKRAQYIPPNIRNEIRLAVENLSVGSSAPLPSIVYAKVNENHPRFSFEGFDYPSLGGLLRAINALEKEDKLKEAETTLQSAAKKPAKAVVIKPEAAPKKTVKQAIPKKVKETIVRTIQEMPHENSGLTLSKLNAKLKLEIKNFAPRKYGHASISKLLNSMNEVILTNGNRSVILANMGKR